MSDVWSQLKHQSRARSLTDAELALANALEALYSAGVSEFDEVARSLTARGVTAPQSGRQTWDVATLEAELAAINASLDEAYARHGIGA
jgi:hypothetical protein